MQSTPFPGPFLPGTQDRGKTYLCEFQMTKIKIKEKPSLEIWKLKSKSRLIHLISMCNQMVTSEIRK